jgi:type IV pilus assembly protein PilP
MGKHLVIMRYLNSTICIVLLLWGCDRTFDATAQPKVVRKKVVSRNEQITNVRTNETIRTEKTTSAVPEPKVVRKKVIARHEQTAKTPTNQTIRVVKSSPSSRPEKKEAAVKTEKSQTKAKNQAAPPGTKSNRSSLIAKKVEVISTGDTMTKLSALKKPALKPISDISEIKRPSTGESTAPSSKLIAATSNVAPKMKSTTIPKAYDARGKIDPFEPLFKRKSVVEKKKAKKRIPQTPLERIDLSQLKLVGIIMASSGNRAMVEESSGKGYIIKKGTYIGVNSGKVVKIKKEKVVVEEEFEDVLGKTELRQREIKLPKPSGEF